MLLIIIFIFNGVPTSDDGLPDAERGTSGRLYIQQ